MANRSAGRLPTHELTARRLRKRNLTSLPALIPYRAPSPALPRDPGARTTVPGWLLAPFISAPIKLNHML